VGLATRLAKPLNRVSLTTGFAVTCAVLGVLPLVAVTALMIVAPHVHAEALDLKAASVREEIARDVELDLLHYNELSNLAVAGGDSVAMQAGQERGIREHLDDAQRAAGTALERQLVEELIRSTRQYFAIRHQLDGRSPAQLAGVIEQSGPALRLALEKATSLRAIARADVAESQDEMRHADRCVHIIFVAVAAAVAASLIGLALVTRWFLIQPVRNLSGSLQRFASGDLATRANETAPRELHDVAQTFNQMASTIVRHREAELTSLAGVAHDLNNPIAVLRLLTDPSTIEGALASEDWMRRTFALVHRQADRLHRMVRDLFDATRLETGELRLEPGEHDLRQTAADAVALYRDVSERHQLRLSLPDAPVIARHDPARIEQAVQNIILNAIKYSPQGGAVTVSVASAGSDALLSVSDQGIGLSAEQRARIFDAFQRYGPPGISGSGLGLCLVRKIVEAHGGAIEVESVAGSGSTFRIRLPLVARTLPQ
jgi:two-component system sensor histidine kinase MtrB